MRVLLPARLTREDDRVTSPDEEYSILHCFADHGAESEVLCQFGDVTRVGIAPTDTNDSTPVQADAHVAVEDKDWAFPLRSDVQFDLGVFHPVCSKWAQTTSISGDPDDHENMIPSARRIATEHCEHFVIENVPQAPLRDEVVLNGRMFGLPIEYERAFETSFRVPEPPRERAFLTGEGATDDAETSSFFFSERSAHWWGSVKGYDARRYPKQHVAKNTIPAPYIRYVVRAWLTAVEDERGLTEERRDYSDYDREMETQRRSTDNASLDEFSG